MSCGAHAPAMHLAFRPHGVVIRSPHVVVLVMAVDNQILRATIDWETLNHVAARAMRDTADLEHFVDTHRRDLAVAIKARLFARGLPVAGELVLSADDLQILQQCSAADAGLDFRTEGIKTSLQPDARSAR